MRGRGIPIHQHSTHIFFLLFNKIMFIWYEIPLRSTLWSLWKLRRILGNIIFQTLHKITLIVWYFVSNKHYFIVVAMDETAIYDYSSVRICLNANIPIATFLFINRWCKAKKPSLMNDQKWIVRFRDMVIPLIHISKAEQVRYLILIRLLFDVGIGMSMDTSASQIPYLTKY
jgi:hypothetical protein